MTTPLEDAQAMLSAYIECEKQILLGKETRLGDRSLRFEDLDMVRAGRKEWEAKVVQLQQTASPAPAFGGRSFSVADFSGQY